MITKERLLELLAHLDETYHHKMWGSSPFKEKSTKDVLIMLLEEMIDNAKT